MNTAEKRLRMRKVSEMRGKNEGKLYTKENRLEKKNTKYKKTLGIM